MARETGQRDSEIGGSKNGNNNALLESLVNGYGNGKYSLAYIVIMYALQLNYSCAAPFTTCGSYIL